MKPEPFAAAFTSSVEDPLRKVNEEPAADNRFPVPDLPVICVNPTLLVRSSAARERKLLEYIRDFIVNSSTGTIGSAGAGVRVHSTKLQTEDQNGSRSALMRTPSENKKAA